MSILCENLHLIRKLKSYYKVNMPSALVEQLTLEKWCLYGNCNVEMTVSTPITGSGDYYAGIIAL